MKISLRVTSNTLPTLAQRLPERAHEVVSGSLLRVAEGCRQRSRVDTGAMRDGWGTSFSGPTDGQVFNDVPHTVFSEYGTRFMSAQPMLAPSIDEERPQFIAEMAKIVSELR